MKFLIQIQIGTLENDALSFVKKKKKKKLIFKVDFENKPNLTKTSSKAFLNKILLKRSSLFCDYSFELT